ncbi:MAG: OmpH family outer membrane protein [Treponema sp.]|jgi:Skp family chaperone for outer membrane proteins|nr:OmpH family outer membrane protein [Treponema sp.]
MKRRVICGLLAAGLACSLWAQKSITRFAVVDMDRVTRAMTGQDAAAALNEKSAAVQENLARLGEELKELEAQLAGAQEEGKAKDLKELEKNVQAKKQEIQVYYRNSMAELEKERAAMALTGDQLMRLSNLLRTVAQNEGFSMVLSKQEGSGILWYSPEVDITARVIEWMRTGGKRR